MREGCIFVGELRNAQKRRWAKNPIAIRIGFSATIQISLVSDFQYKVG